MDPNDTIPPASADDTDRCPALPLELASTIPAPPPEHPFFPIMLDDPSLEEP